MPVPMAPKTRTACAMSVIPSERHVQGALANSTPPAPSRADASEIFTRRDEKAAAFEAAQSRAKQHKQQAGVQQARPRRCRARARDVPASERASD